MKKEMTLCHHICEQRTQESFLSVIQKTAIRVATTWTAVLLLARLYSQIMEEEVSPLLTLRLLHAQVAAFLLMGFAGSNPFVMLTLLCWTMWAVNRCRKAEI